MSTSTGMTGIATSPNAGSDLASLFECPVCFDYVLPPILQCHAGHLVCSNCRPKLTCCPTCRGQLGANIRNLAMEKVASTVLFPCKYSSGGCVITLLHTEKVFRPYLNKTVAPLEVSQRRKRKFTRASKGRLFCRFFYPLRVLQ